MAGPSRRRMLALGAAAAAAPALSACAISHDASPDLRIIYTRSARYHRPDRNPIIVIPGLLGSRLRDPATRQIIWGAFDGAAANPGRTEGVRELAAPLYSDVDTGAAPGLAQPDGVLDRVRVRLAGLPFEVGQYAQILATLGAGGYRDETLGLAGVDYGRDHFTCFQFAYDWRLDNAESATALKAFLDEKRGYIASKYRELFGIDKAPADIKFDVVAHSMGALLLRYFMRYGGQSITETATPTLDWSGAGYFDRAVLVAPPNAGAALALMHLTQGRDFGRPILPYYPPGILGTYASLYQLLPRPRNHPILWNGDPQTPLENLFDPVIWRRYGWGLAAPDQDQIRRELFPAITGEADRLSVATVAQESLLRRATRFAAALDANVGPTPGVHAMLVAGDAIDTPRTLALDERSGVLTIVDKGPGDGAVLRASALLDERNDDAWTPHVRSPLRFNTTLLLAANHMGLTQLPSFSDNVLYWLLEDERDAQAPFAWL